MKNFAIVIAVAFTATLFGCKSPETSGKKPDCDLKNTRWVVESINGEKIVTPEGGHELYILLELDEPRFNGFAGCNRIMGPVETDGKKIDLSKAASTMMMCDRMEVESKFMEALRAVDSYEIKGESMTLLAAGKEVIKFKAVFL